MLEVDVGPASAGVWVCRLWVCAGCGVMARGLGASAEGLEDPSELLALSAWALAEAAWAPDLAAAHAALPEAPASARALLLAAWAQAALGLDPRGGARRLYALQRDDGAAALEGRDALRMLRAVALELELRGAEGEAEDGDERAWWRGPPRPLIVRARLLAVCREREQP